MRCQHTIFSTYNGFIGTYPIVRQGASAFSMYWVGLGPLALGSPYSAKLLNHILRSQQEAQVTLIICSGVLEGAANTELANTEPSLLREIQN